MREEDTVCVGSDGLQYCKVCGEAKEAFFPEGGFMGMKKHSRQCACGRKAYEEEQKYFKDKQLLEKMYAERKGIVKKTVKALQTVIANGYRFTEPDSITEVRRDYQSVNSTVISFYEECMCPWENGKIIRHCTTGKIYKVY